jgi:hypothetical protein
MLTLLIIAAVVIAGFGVFAWVHERHNSDKEPPAI